MNTKQQDINKLFIFAVKHNNTFSFPYFIPYPANVENMVSS